MASDGPRPVACDRTTGASPARDEGVVMRVPPRSLDELGGLRGRPDGARETVDVALVDPVAPGDSVLVHAGVALIRRGGGAGGSDGGGVRLLSRSTATRRWARALAGEILAVRRTRPPLQADGGVRRAHALHLQVRRRRPAARQRGAGARAGVPGLRDPMGRVDDGIAIAREPGVLFTCFGDMMRVPGRRGDASSTRRPRAPTCGWSTRRSTRCGSRARTPTARWCSSRSASRRPRRRPR